MNSTPHEPARMYGSSTSDADNEEQTGIIVAFAAHDRFAKRNAVVELGLTLPLSVTEGARANLNITAVRASVVAQHAPSSKIVNRIVLKQFISNKK